MKPEEYDEFYKQISHDTEPPAEVIHYAAEGKTEFKVLAFIPAHKPLACDWQEPRTGLKLYVQRVLIMDRCEQLLPFYLRFVQGVVDSADLPLNVSREILAAEPAPGRDPEERGEERPRHARRDEERRVREVPRVLQGLRAGAQGRARPATGRTARRSPTCCCSRRANTEAGKFTTLAEYVEKMPTDQKEIYYLIGESAEQLRKSPYLEAFRAKGRDVLLLTDPIDEFAMPQLGRVQGEATSGRGPRRHRDR